jgi:8-oxo-dGTP diphosphatase
MVDLPLGDLFGNYLLSIRSAAGAELEVVEDPAATPLSLAVVRCAGGVLMVLDSQRRQWELPGGMREHGESAWAAAQRELAEETGISAADLSFAALAEFSLVRPARREFAAVYQTTLALRPPLLINEEVLDFRWWDPRSPVLSDMSPLDAEIARHVAIGPIP